MSSIRNVALLSTLLLATGADAFLTAPTARPAFTRPRASTREEAPPSFIATELRDAAMKLHTTRQAPKEGRAEAPQEPAEKHETTHADYLQFLVDSKFVYETFERIIGETPELAYEFTETGMERVKPLAADIEWMSEEFRLDVPTVGEYGLDYAASIAEASRTSAPAFLCHYYNYYFAHTAGGRMIGKQLGAKLLNKRELEFYKYDGDLNKIKASVKEKIEAMAAQWTRTEKDQCVAETAAVFKGAGSINRYLAGDY